MAKSDESKSEQRNATATGAATRQTADKKPVYEKPRLRRYDQIDQVKPYGPSEL
jgi:hypothetical protein